MKWKMKLISHEEQQAFIEKARATILTKINLGPPEYLPKPLQYAFYVFLFKSNDLEKPIGVAEGFVMNQAYKDEVQSPYHRGTTLSKLARLDNVFHIRSVFIEETHHRSGFEFILLVVGMIKIAALLGVQFISTATTEESTGILDLYPRLGLQACGQFQIGQFFPLLFVGKLSEEARMLQYLKRFEDHIQVDEPLLREIGLRKAYT